MTLTPEGERDRQSDRFSENIKSPLLRRHDIQHNDNVHDDIQHENK